MFTILVIRNQTTGTDWCYLGAEPKTMGLYGIYVNLIIKFNGFKLYFKPKKLALSILISISFPMSRV